jgi:hypothetical protein
VQEGKIEPKTAYFFHEKNEQCFFLLSLRSGRSFFGPISSLSAKKWLSAAILNFAVAAVSRIGERH